MINQKKPVSSIKQEIESLKSQIAELIKKETCECGKTLFFYDKDFIYIKCRHCGVTKKFKR
jgi:hypothetical protein